MNQYTITQLPSGYWCVWFGGEWIEPSLPTKEAAEEFIRKREAKKGRRQ